MIIGHCCHFLHVQTSTFLTETAVVIESESHMTSHDPPVSNLGGVGVWSVEGSIMSTKEFDFTVPNDTMKEEQKKADSLDLVIDLIHRVNENQAELADVDSKALRGVHCELQRVSEIIKGFLEYSTNLVSEEGGLSMITNA